MRGVRVTRNRLYSEEKKERKIISNHKIGGIVAQKDRGTER
jgi:hypothetical protein